MYDSTQDTLDHIDKVKEKLWWFEAQLRRRADVHDASKLEPQEKPYFDELSPLLAGVTYGSDEYKELLVRLGPALEHHYANNRHHPEHWPDGIDNMNLVDIVEMFCDWYAASQRHADGDISKSIEYNRTRFDMDNQLYRIFMNTVGMVEGKK